MKITKKAKPVFMQYRQELIPSLRSEYTCPTCNTTFLVYLQKNVLVFVCDCGQKLSVKQPNGK